MTTDVERLVVSLEASITKYERAMQRATAQTNKTAKGIEDRFRRSNATVAAQFDSLGVGIAKAFAGVAALKGAQQLLDASTRITNSLKSAGLEGEALASVYDDLYGSAKRNGAPLEGLVTLYSRVAMAQKDLGVSSQQITGLTENVAKAIRLSGGDAESASGALLQLGQALGGGTVQAEEYNSLIDGLPGVLQAAANGIEQAGGSVSKLTRLVKDGKISSIAFFDGIASGSGILDNRLAGSVLTIGQSFENLKTSLTDAAGKFDLATGSSNAAGTALNELANVIGKIGNTFRDNSEPIRDFVGMMNEAQRYINMIPGVNPFANVGRDINGVIDGIEDLKGATQGAADEIDRAQKSVELFLQSFTDVNSSIPITDEQRKQVEAIAKDFDGTRESANKTLEAMLSLGDKDLDLSKFINPLINLVAQLDMVSAAGNKAAKAANFDDIGVFPSAGLAGMGKPVDIEQSKYRPPAATPKGSKAKSPGAKFSDTLEDQQRRLDSLRAETALQSTLNPLISDYGYAIEKLRVQQDLENQAAKAGLELSPERKQAIADLAEGYASATVEAAKLSEAQDLTRQSMEDWFDLGKSATRGFIDDLVEGKSAAEALGNAFQQLGSKLLDIGLDSLFGTGSGSNSFGLIGKAFGFAKGGIAKNGKPMKAFAGGGVSNTAAIFGEGPMAEAAVPLPDGRRIPVDLRMPSIRSAGSASSITAPVTIQIDATGADAAGLARLQAQLAQLRQDLPTTIVGAVRTAKQQGKLK